jgi:hypothetical protein
MRAFFYGPGFVVDLMPPSRAGSLPQVLCTPQIPCGSEPARDDDNRHTTNPTASHKKTAIPNLEMAVLLTFDHTFDRTHPATS